MAQHRRVRSRTTPQPDFSHHRTTRITRSQSRDIDQPPYQSASRATRRGDRDTSVQSNAGADGTYTRNSRASRRPGGRDLSIVQEHADVPYPDLPEPNAEDAVGAREVTPSILSTTYEYDVHQSPDAQSTISGITTISTAGTIRNPAELDPELMLDSLDDLHTDSGKILEILAPKTASADHLSSVVSDATDPTSKVSQVLEKRWSRFKEACQYFCVKNQDSDFIISRDTVLSSFARNEDTYDIFRRPDAILYKANLAAFAKRMATVSREPQEVHPLLQFLDNTFPRHFTSSLGGEYAEDLDRGSSAIVEETFKLALDLRTQLAVYLLAKPQDEQTSDPDATIHSVFSKGEEDDDDVTEGPLLRGWEVPGLSDGDLSRPMENAILQRIKRIRRCLQPLEQGSYVDSKTLHAQLPWSDFVERALDWARLRNAELDKGINSLGGVPEIQASLTEYLETGIAQYPSQNIPRTAPAAISVLRKHLDRLKGQDISIRNDELAKAPTESNAAASEAMGATKDYQSSVLDEEEDEDDSRTFVDPPVERNTVQEDLERLRLREKQNKENMRRSSAEAGGPPRKSFYDRQANASRVSFDEPGETASPSKSQDKRRRADTQSDEDEHFETRIANSKRQVPVRKKPRYAPASASPSSTNGQSQASRAPGRAAGALLDESDDDESGPSHAQQLKSVNQQARALASIAFVPTAKGRTPWSDDEVNAFLELIQECANETQPWKSIKTKDEARDNVLFRRSNTDLKDKAMNIICSYKLAGQDLPPGLDGFRLPKNLQAKVDLRRGVSPAR